MAPSWYPCCSPCKRLKCLDFAHDFSRDKDHPENLPVTNTFYYAGHRAGTKGFFIQDGAAKAMSAGAVLTHGELIRTEEASWYSSPQYLRRGINKAYIRLLSDSDWIVLGHPSEKQNVAVKIADGGGGLLINLISNRWTLGGWEYEVIGDFTLTGAVNVGEFFWLTWCTRRYDTLTARYELERADSRYVNISITRGPNDLDFDLTSGLDCSYIADTGGGLRVVPRPMIGISDYLANLNGVEVQQFYGWSNWHEGWSAYFPRHQYDFAGSEVEDVAQYSGTLKNCEVCLGCVNEGYIGPFTITPPRVDPISGTWAGLGEQDTEPPFYHVRTSSLTCADPGALLITRDSLPTTGMANGQYIGSSRQEVYHSTPGNEIRTIWGYKDSNNYNYFEKKLERIYYDVPHPVLGPRTYRDYRYRFAKRVEGTDTILRELKFSNRWEDQDFAKLNTSYVTINKGHASAPSITLPDVIGSSGQVFFAYYDDKPPGTKCGVGLGPTHGGSRVTFQTISGQLNTNEYEGCTGIPYPRNLASDIFSDEINADITPPETARSLAPWEFEIEIDGESIFTERPPEYTAPPCYDYLNSLRGTRILRVSHADPQYGYLYYTDRHLTWTNASNSWDPQVYARFVNNEGSLTVRIAVTIPASFDTSAILEAENIVDLPIDPEDYFSGWVSIPWRTEIFPGPSNPNCAIYSGEDAKIRFKTK